MTPGPGIKLGTHWWEASALMVWWKLSRLSLRYFDVMSVFFGCQQMEVMASRHKDDNSVACIVDKCYVLSYPEYCR